MTFVDIRIEWNTALNENSVKYEIIKALEKQYPEIKFTFSMIPATEEIYDDFIEGLYQGSMHIGIPEDDIPDWVMNGGQG